MRFVRCQSNIMTLLPGDVLTTATPSGVGPLRPGDAVEVRVAGVGSLVNPLVAEPDSEGRIEGG